MTLVSGKAEGRCRGVEGVAGWFSPGFRGYAAAAEWRDGQTTHEPEVRDRWVILERVDARWGVLRTWCLPPSMGARALADPGWTPDVPFDLLPPATRWALIDAAALNGSPPPGRDPLWPRPDECSPITSAGSPDATPKRRGRRKQPAAAGS